MKFTVDTDLRRKRIQNRHDAEINQIRAKREQLNSKERLIKNNYAAQIALIDELEKEFGNKAPKAPKAPEAPEAQKRNYTNTERQIHTFATNNSSPGEMRIYARDSKIPVSTLYGWRKRFGTKKKAAISKNQKPAKRPSNVKNRIIEVLKVNPSTVAQIIKKTGMNHHSVSNAITSLKKDKTLTHTTTKPAVYSVSTVKYPTL